MRNIQWMFAFLVASSCLGVLADSEVASDAAYTPASLDVQIGMPYQGGYSCPGKVSYIKCFADHNGMLAGIIYDNDATGIRRRFCRTGNDVAVVGEYTLDATEVIVKVEACRGYWYGYGSVTFYTDTGRVLKCGTGRADYRPPKFVHSYKSYWAYGAARVGFGSAGYNLRPMEAVVSTYSDPDTFAKKKLGWGWGSLCQAYTSPKKASWATCPACQDWYQGGTSGPNWGVRSSGGYRSLWDMYNSYYKYAGPTESGGRYLHYYKDYTTYQRQSSICQQDESCPFQPSYYFKELYPLARFEAMCDRNGNIYNMYAFCWNKAYVPPTPPPVDNVVVTFQIVMAEGEGCPTDVELYNILGQLVYQLGVDYPELAGLQVVVDANTIDCRREQPGVSNTTVTADAFLTPPANMTVEELLFILRSIPGGTDLCTLPGEYCLPSVYSIFIQYASNPVELRNQLTNRRIRTRMVNAKLLKAAKR